MSHTSPTWAEILQQPETWLATHNLVTKHPAAGRMRALRAEAILCGAGSSAYAGGAIAAAWPGAREIPTTDLVTGAARLPETIMMVSLARSGNSPESIAAVERVARLRPAVEQFAITCNAEGRLAGHAGVTSIVLDPRTNDRALAMTSSFSNLVLAGLCVSHGEEIGAALDDLYGRVLESSALLSDHAAEVARRLPRRAVVLAPPALLPWAREAALKMLELTGGKIAVLPETFLGLRHGPMSFLTEKTLVLALLSSDPRTRRYEEDVLAELRAKKLGHLVGILPEGCDERLVDHAVPAMAGGLPDFLRTPFEIFFAQMLAYHASAQSGLDPDNPSPNSVITRVVPNFRIYGE